MDNGPKLKNKVHVPNCKSASVYKKKVEKAIRTEVENGNYVRSIEKPLIISALGAVPKPNGEVRVIHDASRPEGLSLNDHAEAEPFKYQTVQAVLHDIGPGYFLSKVDLKSAYRSVGIRPGNFKYTGLQWTFESDTEPITLIDTRLPFGSKLSPSIFNRLTQSVCRMMSRRGFNCRAY